MSNNQITFEELFQPEKSTSSKKPAGSKKTTRAKKTVKSKNEGKSKIENKTRRVSFTQDELDKLCEVYDWYMSVKDRAPLKQVNRIGKTNIKIEEDIIKEPKRVSVTIDKDVWDNFSTLASNISQKKGNLLTEIVKEYLNQHKDLY